VPPDMVCDGFKGPAAIDTCDGLDNDCDGIIDEDGCPGTTDVCVDGQCVFQCAVGEFPCPFGFLCEDLGDASCDTPPCNFCVPDPCVDVTCPTGFFCTGGECIDLCEGIVCQTGETCINGNCRDCFTPALACEEECQVCETGPGGVGRCVVDQCCNVECDDGEFCREGDCVRLTCDPPCAANQICDDGECQADPCFGVSCPEGQVCNPNEGGCRPDLCATVTCPTGQVCHPGTGMCVSDPCTQVTCPEGFECQIDFEGGAQCRQPLRDEERIYAAGGGCGCQAGGSGGALWPVLVLFGWFFGTRRRRRPRPVA
jgi:Notch 1